MAHLAELEELAALLNDRNRVDARIAELIGRPALAGHIGEFLAASILDVALNRSASTAATDGTFASGPLAGRSVNVKLYGKNEGLVDLPRDGAVSADYILVLSGPRSGLSSSKGSTRPVVINSVHLFLVEELLRSLRMRGVKIGVATSVAREFWDAAEIYPRNTAQVLVLNETQRRMLALFAPASPEEDEISWRDRTTLIVDTFDPDNPPFVVNPPADNSTPESDAYAREVLQRLLDHQGRSAPEEDRSSLTEPERDSGHPSSDP